MSIEDRVETVTGLDIRQAEATDIQAMAELFSADGFGHGDAWNEENAPAYRAAFQALERSADSTLYVVTEGGNVIGTFMLTFMPVFYGRGAHRLILEGVQVSSERRSLGIGRFILGFVERTAKELGAKCVVLTSNKKRLDAHRFYEKNGYVRSHDGFKKVLE